MTHLDRLLALREDNDYKQKEIAKIINVSQSTYSDYELGKIRIPIEYMVKLAQFYNVDMNYLCGISDIKKPYPRK